MNICSTLTDEYKEISDLAERSQQLLDQLSQSGDKNIHKQLTNTLTNITKKQETFEGLLLERTKLLLLQWKEKFSLKDSQFDVSKIQMKEGKIVYAGNIKIYSSLPDTFFFPRSIDTIKGNLDLSYTKTFPPGTQLFKQVEGFLNLSSLKHAEKVIFPERVRSAVFLSGLTSGPAKLPGEIEGDLYLNNLVVGQDVQFPIRVGGNVDLRKLNQGRIQLPQEIGGDLQLPNLEQTERVTFPTKIGGSVHVPKLSPNKVQNLQEKYSHLRIQQ